MKTKVELIYQDDDIIVINKPAGASVTKDRTGSAELARILADKLGQEQAGTLRLVHRLDKFTSGVIILAKNKQAQSRFSGYFEKRLIKKTYLAIVTGVPTGNEGTIDAPLARSSKDPQLMQIDRKKGKSAITHWRLLADFGTAVLLAVMPLTGRTHQIRVHLADAGLPLAIDPLYGSGQPIFLSDFKADYRLAKNQTEKPLLQRLSLHAYQLEVLNPQTNQPDLFIARLDKKFAATLKMLTKHNPKGPDAFVNTDDFSNIINAERIS